MIIDNTSRQQYFGALIVTWDSLFVPPPLAGIRDHRFVFNAYRKRYKFESKKGRFIFLSVEKDDD